MTHCKESWYVEVVHIHEKVKHTLNRPRVFQETEDPRFWENKQMKVVRLLTLHTPSHL